MTSLHVICAPPIKNPGYAYIANGSPLLQHFFERRSVAKAQRRRDGSCNASSYYKGFDFGVASGMASNGLNPCLWTRGLVEED